MNNKIKLNLLLNEVENNELVLPDFQREYVWMDEEDKVKKFIASVLAQIPIGSIITFNKSSDSFANKELGFNTTITFNPNRNVNYLLDGQQRVTTLGLVFSDRIFKKIVKGKRNKADLLRQQMLRRYFLKLPMFNQTESSSDFFGFLNFNFTDPNPNKVSFCSNEIEEYIDSVSFNFTKSEWYQPKDYDLFSPHDTINYVDDAVNNARIPLYLLSYLDAIGTKENDLIERIIEAIVKKRFEYLKSIYSVSNINDIKAYIKKDSRFNLIDLNKNEMEIISEFYFCLDTLANNWKKSFIIYLKECMNVSLQNINVTNEDTARAINIYEALNEGGVSLSTFDLIIAKAAIEQKNHGPKTYYETVKDILLNYYNVRMANVLLNSPATFDWNTKDQMSIYKSEKISNDFIQQFLNLLCIIVNFNDNGNPVENLENPKNLNSNYCKEKKQLAMSSNEIWEFSNIALESICDALQFMQMELGIINFNSIDNKLTILPIAYTMFLLKKMQIDDLGYLKCLKKIKSWYWYILFCGEYNTDQNDKVIKHIKLMHNWIYKNIIPTIFENTSINSNLNLILNIPKYNDQNTLMLQYEDITPKKTVINSLLQYVLSHKPIDILGMAKIELWKNPPLQIHHVVPLASATTINESTSTIRGDKQHLLNSPLNLAYILKGSNSAISSYPVSHYKGLLSQTFLAEYYYDNSITTLNFDPSNTTTVAELKAIYINRYNQLCSHIKKEIQDNL